jgi:acetyltransferase-like isoleucine patch superfamily enzyme
MNISENVKRLIKDNLLILGENVEIQENVVLGIPEEGEPDNLNPIIIGDNTIIRAGAIIYQGVHIGSNVRIGHNNVLRSYAKIGDHTVLSHNIVIEHHASLGKWVRISPHTHITSHTIIEDSVFIGAGVVTINETIGHSSSYGIVLVDFIITE